jgi:hypothetical protein
MPSGKSKRTGSSGSNSKVSKRKARARFNERHIDQVFDDFTKDPTAVHDEIVGPVGNFTRCFDAKPLP